MGLQVSPRCFPCRCSGQCWTQLAKQIDSCTLAAVLRQKQAGRITGGLFFLGVCENGVGRDPTIDPPKMAIQPPNIEAPSFRTNPSVFGCLRICADFRCTLLRRTSRPWTQRLSAHLDMCSACHWRTTA